MGEDERLSASKGLEGKMPGERRLNKLKASRVKSSKDRSGQPKRGKSERGGKRIRKEEIFSLETSLTGRIKCPPSRGQR